MCIIIFKPAGEKLPSEESLYQCWLDNPDGMGYMYRNISGKIIIIKGFNDIEDMLDSIKNLNYKDLDIAIHFRYATHGSISPGNSHPFPLTKKVHKLRELRSVCNVGIMHNGIVKDVDHLDKTLSDTMIAIKILSDCGENSTEGKDILKTGKFLIMDKHDTRLYGDFIYDEGIYYSNNGYIVYDDKNYNEDILDKYLANTTYSYKDYDAWEIWDGYSDEEKEEKCTVNDDYLYYPMWDF